MASGAFRAQRAPVEVLWSQMAAAAAEVTKVGRRYLSPQEWGS